MTAAGLVLETSRLALRQWRDDDLAALHRTVLGNPEVMVFSLGALDLEETAAWLERKRAAQRKTGFSHWAVEEKETGRLAGLCGIMMQELPEGRFPEVGYRFARKLWGRGLATEAASGVVGWAWSHTRFGRLIAIIHPENRGSIRVAEKTGLTLAWETEWFGETHLIFSIDNPQGGERGPF